MPRTIHNAGLGNIETAFFSSLNRQGQVGRAVGFSDRRAGDFQWQ
jgi:hypothetical protein